MSLETDNLRIIIREQNNKINELKTKQEEILEYLKELHSRLSYLKDDDGDTFTSQSLPHPPRL